MVINETSTALKPNFIFYLVIIISYITTAPFQFQVAQKEKRKNGEEEPVTQWQACRGPLHTFELFFTPANKRDNTRRAQGYKNARYALSPYLAGKSQTSRWMNLISCPLMAMGEKETISREWGVRAFYPFSRAPIERGAAAAHPDEVSEGRGR